MKVPEAYRLRSPDRDPKAKGVLDDLALIDDSTTAVVEEIRFE